MSKSKTTNSNNGGLDLSGKYTGRVLMSMPGAVGTSSGIRSFKKSMGLNVASSRDFKNQSFQENEVGDGIILDHLGIAILDPHGDEALMRKMMSTRSIGAQSGVHAERERVLHAISEEAYNKGFQDALKSIKNKLALTSMDVEQPDFEDYKNLLKTHTWGLLKTRVVTGPSHQQRYTGKNIKLCVLDTGIDATHPDFVGREIIAKSFIPGQEVHDRHGHGTHCAGTAAGILMPKDKKIPRYGIAHESKLFVGKVLNNAGSGADGWILAGINWALSQKCEVISMSIGGDTDDDAYSSIYENAAIKALQQGSIIIAAAGNSYPSSPAVNHPANCPSIMAVAALDEKLIKASFSCIGKFPPAGKIDIAGPGVKVLSAASKPHTGLLGIGATEKYGNLNGTSMATPHVAGIAALYAQKSKKNRGEALWQKLITSALPLNQSVTSVGAGLVQAPYSKKVTKKTVKRSAK